MTTEQMRKKRGTKKSAHVRWWKKRRPIVHLLLRIILLFASCVHGFGGYNKNCEQEECVCVGVGRERWSELYSHLTRRIFLCVRFPLHFISFFRKKKRNRLKIFPQYFVRGLGIMGEERKKNPRMVSTPRLFLFPYAINFKWCMPWLRQGRGGGVSGLWSFLTVTMEKKKNKKAIYKGNLLSCPSGREWSISCWLAIPAQGSTSNRFQLLLLLWLLLLRDGYISFSLAFFGGYHYCYYDDSLCVLPLNGKWKVDTCTYVCVRVTSPIYHTHTHTSIYIYVTRSGHLHNSGVHDGSGLAVDQSVCVCVCSEFVVAKKQFRVVNRLCVVKDVPRRRQVYWKKKKNNNFVWCFVVSQFVIHLFIVFPLFRLRYTYRALREIWN